MNNIRNREIVECLKEKLEEIIDALKDFDIDIEEIGNDIEYDVQDDELVELLDAFNHLYNIVYRE